MILDWIRSLQGTVVLIGLALTAGWGWLYAHDKKIENRTTSTIVQRSENQGKRNAESSRKAHDAAGKPGALDRLRADPKSCPDCK